MSYVCLGIPQAIWMLALLHSVCQKLTWAIWFLLCCHWFTPKSSHLVHNKVVGLHVTETHYCVAMFHESIVIVSREHLYYFSLKMCSISFSESKHRWGPAMAQWSAWASLTPSHPPQCFSWCLLRKWEEQSKKRETLPRWTMSCLWHQWIALINW